MNKYNPKMLDKLSKLKTAYSLDDIMPFGKYGKRHNINWIIEHDPAYMYWLVTEKNFEIDKEAQIMLTYEYEIYLERKNQSHNFLSDRGFL